MLSLLAQAGVSIRSVLLFVLVAVLLVGGVILIDSKFPIAPNARWIVGIILVIGFLLGAGAWFGLF